MKTINDQADFKTVNKALGVLGFGKGEIGVRKKGRGGDPRSGQGSYWDRYKTAKIKSRGNFPLYGIQDVRELHALSPPLAG